MSNNIHTYLWQVLYKFKTGSRQVQGRFKTGSRQVQRS
jgi:hypothetical protein